MVFCILFFFFVLFDSTVPTSGGLLAGFQFKCITGVEINNMATVNAVMEMKFYVHLCEISLNSHSSYICSCICLCVCAYIWVRWMLVAGGPRRYQKPSGMGLQRRTPITTFVAIPLSRTHI